MKRTIKVHTSIQYQNFKLETLTTSVMIYALPKACLPQSPQELHQIISLEIIASTMVMVAVNMIIPSHSLPYAHISIVCKITPVDTKILVKAVVILNCKLKA